MVCSFLPRLAARKKTANQWQFGSIHLWFHRHLPYGTCFWILVHWLALHLMSTLSNHFLTVFTIGAMKQSLVLLSSLVIWPPIKVFELPLAPYPVWGSVISSLSLELGKEGGVFELWAKNVIFWNPMSFKQVFKLR